MCPLLEQKQQQNYAVSVIYIRKTLLTQKQRCLAWKNKKEETLTL